MQIFEIFQQKITCLLFLKKRSNDFLHASIIYIYYLVTKALLEAVPIPDPQERGRERNLLQGEIGSSTNPPDGCRFHPRCPYAVEQCRHQPPRLQKIGSDSGKGKMILPDHEKVQAAELDMGKERKKDVTVDARQQSQSG